MPKLRLRSSGIALWLFFFVLAFLCSCNNPNSRNDFVDGTAPAYSPDSIYTMDQIDIIDKNSEAVNKIVFFFNRCVSGSTLTASDFELKRNTSIKDTSLCAFNTNNYSPHSCLDDSKWETLDFANDYFQGFVWGRTTKFNPPCGTGYYDRVTILLKDVDPPVLWRWQSGDSPPALIAYKLTLKDRENGPLIDQNNNKSSSDHNLWFFVSDGNLDPFYPELQSVYPRPQVSDTALPIPPHYPIKFKFNKPVANLMYIDLLEFIGNESTYPPDTPALYPSNAGVGIYKASEYYLSFPTGLAPDSTFQALFFLQQDNFNQYVYENYGSTEPVSRPSPDYYALNRAPIVDLVGNKLRVPTAYTSAVEDPVGSGIYELTYDYAYDTNYVNSYPITYNFKTAPVRIDKPNYDTILLPTTTLSGVTVSGKCSPFVNRIDFTFDYWENSTTNGGLGLSYPAKTITKSGSGITMDYSDTAILNESVPEIYPAISKDGTKVVYWAKDANQIFQLYRYDLESHEKINLTNFQGLNETISHLNQPSVSYDGDKIVFLSDRDIANNTTSYGEIYLWTGEQGLLQITTDPEWDWGFTMGPSISSNGTRAFFYWDDMVSIMTFSTDDPLNVEYVSPGLLGPMFGMSASDEGDYIVFTGKTPNCTLGDEELFIIDLFGHRTKLTDTHGSVFGTRPLIINKSNNEYWVYFTSIWNLSPLGTNSGELELFVCRLNVTDNPIHCDFEQVTDSTASGSAVYNFTLDENASSIVLNTNEDLSDGGHTTNSRLIYLKPRRIPQVVGSQVFYRYDNSWFTVIRDPIDMSVEPSISGDGKQGVYHKCSTTACTDGDIYKFTFEDPLSSFSLSMQNIKDTVCYNNPSISCSLLFTDRYHLRFRAKAYDASNNYLGFDEIPIHYDTDGDADEDGLPDSWEISYGLSPTDPGILPDGNPDNGPNGDPDGDGLTNLEEYQHGTDPTSVDSDGDGIPDKWELDNGLDPTDPDDADDNNDTDGLNNYQEYTYHTDPSNNDTDGDGLTDYQETYLYETDPNNPDTDFDAISDYDEVHHSCPSPLNHLDPLNFDTDADGLPDGFELSIGTDPCNPDSDGDGMPDGYEYEHGLNPLVNDAGVDTDGDGISNISEMANGTDPGNPDSDFDGIPDGSDTCPFNKDTNNNGVLDGYETMKGCMGF